MIFIKCCMILASDLVLCGRTKPPNNRCAFQFLLWSYLKTSIFLKNYFFLKVKRFRKIGLYTKMYLLRLAVWPLVWSYHWTVEGAACRSLFCSSISTTGKIGKLVDCIVWTQTFSIIRVSLITLNLLTTDVLSLWQEPCSLNVCNLRWVWEWNFIFYSSKMTKGNLTWGSTSDPDCFVKLLWVKLVEVLMNLRRQFSWNWKHLMNTGDLTYMTWSLSFGFYICHSMCQSVCTSMEPKLLYFATMNTCMKSTNHVYFVSS